MGECLGGDTEIDERVAALFLAQVFQQGKHGYGDPVDVDRGHLLQVPQPVLNLEQSRVRARRFDAEFSCSFASFLHPLSAFLVVRR